MSPISAKHLLFILVLLALCSCKSSAQLFEISNSNWASAGLNKSIISNDDQPQLLSRKEKKSIIITRYFDEDLLAEYNFVEDFGGNNMGEVDNSKTLEYALENTPDYSVIFFPPGVYLFEESISIPNNKIIKGRSPNTTSLIFDLKNRNEPLINIQGSSSNEYWNLDSIGPIGSNQLFLDRNEFFEIGDAIEIERENDPNLITKEKEWSKWAIGGIFKIVDIDNEIIYLDKNITFN